LHGNRVLRLFPTYWALLLFGVAVAYYRPTLDAFLSRVILERAADGSTASLLAAVPNLMIVGSDWLRQLVADPITGEVSVLRVGMDGGQPLDRYLFAPQMWSVSNEIVFYLAAPLLARLNTASFCLLAAVTCLLTPVATSSDLVWGLLLPHRNFVFFLLGMGACRLLPHYHKLPRAMLVTLALVPFAYWLTEGSLNVLKPVIVVVAWVPYIVGIPALFLLTKHDEVDRFLGDLSYPVYVCHFMFAVQNWQTDYAALIVGVQACAFAFLAVLLIERPAQRLRHKWSRQLPLHS
jgi:peptidoglycan/LPS O-acetylase OafA/YrhL